jgi:flagellar hook-basal body complex protein FliE
MSNSINGLGVPQPPVPPAQPGSPTLESSDGQQEFGRLLLDSLNHADSAQHTAQAEIEKGLAEGDITQIEIMSSVKKADMALRMMIQVRNKILDAYDEIKQLRMA